MTDKSRVATVFFCLPAILLGSRAVTAQTVGHNAAPGAEVNAARFPEAGAVVLSWDQRWTLQPDGTVHRREHKLVKLLERRAIKRVADPRIDFVEGRDTVTIHKAQTILPDGEVLPVPDYSFNLAAPNDVAGWPEYADWRQRIVSFSAVEPGAVLELVYDIETTAGATPWFDADLLLHSEFPVLRRTITAAFPKGTQLRHRIDNLSNAPNPTKETNEDGETRLKWNFNDLPADLAEPQSLPRYRRAGRLRFTNCPSGKMWVSETLVSIDNAVQASGAIRIFADKVISEERNPAEQARLLSNKLRDTFNFVSSPKTLRSMRCRNAAEVLSTNYGNPLESAALLLAMARAVGLQATIELAVRADQWDLDVPTTAGFAGGVVVIELPEGPMYLHPQHGEFLNPGSWGGHDLLSLDVAEDLRTTRIYARGKADQSRLNVTGQLTISDDGQATGNFHIRLTGGFYDPVDLKSADQQKKFIERLLSHTLTDFKLAGHSITTLSNDTLQATATLSTEALKSVAGRYLLQFGDGPLFLEHGFPLPLSAAIRHTAVKSAGAFVENVDIVIQLPDTWPISGQSTTAVRKGGNWGAAVQERIADGRTIRFRRTIDVKADTFAPSDFIELRELINTLRSTNHTHLVITPRS